MTLNNSKNYPRNVKKLESLEQSSRVKLILKDIKKVNQVASTKKLEIPCRSSEGTLEQHNSDSSSVDAKADSSEVLKYSNNDNRNIFDVSENTKKQQSNAQKLIQMQISTLVNGER